MKSMVVEDTMRKDILRMRYGQKYNCQSWMKYMLESNMSLDTYSQERCIKLVAIGREMAICLLAVK